MLKTIRLVKTASVISSNASPVTSLPVTSPRLLLVTFTVRLIDNLSVSVFQLMPSTAPPSFCTIGPSASPLQAITFSKNPPFANSAARVPVVCQFSSISPLSLWITSFISAPLGRSSTKRSISTMSAATKSTCLFISATLRRQHSSMACAATSPKLTHKNP